MHFFFTFVILAVSCGCLQASCCGGFESGASKYARLEGWSAVDAGRTLDQTIKIPGTQDSPDACLASCITGNPKCYMISYNYINATCVGFARKATQGFAPDKDSVLLAKTTKRMYPQYGGIFAGGTIQSGVGSAQVKNVGTQDICQSLCVMSPTCNYAVFSENGYECWVNWLSELGVKHTDAKVAANKFVGFMAQ